MLAIPDAVVKILAHPAPVVFLDTCVLLDIIRAPQRNASENVLAAQQLLEGVCKAPPTVYVPIACPTPVEWKDHVDSAVSDCDDAVNSVSAVAEAFRHLGFPGILSLPGSAPSLPNLPKDLSSELLNAVILLDKDREAMSRAVDRIIHSKRPARTGGKGAKDAMILDHALELARSLRQAGFVDLCLFVSSNISDFAVKSGTKLHPELQPEFDSPTNLQYAVNLTGAVQILMNTGWLP